MVRPGLFDVFLNLEVQRIRKAMPHAISGKNGQNRFEFQWRGSFGQMISLAIGEQNVLTSKGVN